MPFRLLQKWPKAFGFEIYGNGPSYVIAVEKGSLAYKSGLMPGDQLLEVGGQDVTTLSADEIKVLARGKAKQPPEVEVVSTLQTLIIKPETKLGYGFTVLNEKPISVKSVEFGSPAYQCGLRSGDIILEANCNSKAVTQNINSILALKSGQMTMLIIPASRTSNLVQVDKNLSHATGSESRVYKAKAMHAKLENVLGEDYKRKMSVVTALKQYAEDRDITLLCKALNNALKSSESKKILNLIRLLIPPTDRTIFDKFTLCLPIQESLTTGQMSSRSSSYSLNSKTVHERKLIQLVKNYGSFGFIIKSSHPAYIESIDRGGAAEQAGLKVGDCIIKLNNIDVSKCDHERLIQLLQESGSAPTLEILRTLDYQQDGSMKSTSTLQSSSSSSHDSEEMFLLDESTTDKDGHTFSDKADYLLTPQERILMKKALKKYGTTRNIAHLHECLSSLFDTPSKKLLWGFVMNQLPALHQEFILHRVDLSQSYSIMQEETRQSLEVSEIPGFPATAQQQIDFLLTFSERHQFRKCLSDYETNKKITPLIESLETMLDSPSKQILWQVVIPLLTKPHREIIHEKVGLRLQGMDSNDEFVDEQSSNEEDSESLISWNTNNSKNNNQSRSDLGADYDDKLMQELGATKRAVQEIRDALFQQNKEKEPSTSSADDLRETNEKSYVTIIPVGLTDQELEMFSKMNSFLLKGNSQKDSNLSKSSKGNTAVGILADSHIYYSSDSGSEDEDGDSSGSHEKNSILHFEQSDTDPLNKPKVTLPLIVNKPKTMKKMDFGLKSVRLSNQGWKNQERFSEIQQRPRRNESLESLEKERNTFQHAQTTTNGQISHKESYKFQLAHTPPVVQTTDKESYTKHHAHTSSTVETLEQGSNTVQSIPPAPLPPPPLLLSVNQGLEESFNKMSVKRINWEKLDNKTLQNTIWEKLSNQDLAGVINYLELETQFSTKPTLQKEKAKRKEVLIMDGKKAYNISILLGHLKMPVTDIKKALYSADEKILSPGLLEQLLSFVPSQNEVTKYKLYAGDASLLTKPDQFIYQMSLVGNYEERLRGLLFKANFKEKCHELKQNLHNIKTAAIQLRTSEKLARLLEIILAMGNYMNKGNNRIGEAAGFRITFLRQLDTTKTTDNKSSFLHVLADAVYNKFPEVLSLGDELSSVQKAAKISHEALVQDIQYLRKSLQETTTFLSNISQQTLVPEDCFKEVLDYFLVDARKEIEMLEKLNDTTMAEFYSTVSFFGEDPNVVTIDDLYEIFCHFVQSFEKAHSHNLMFKKK